MAPKKGSHNPCVHSYKLELSNGFSTWWKAVNAREAVVTFRLAHPEMPDVASVSGIGLNRLEERRWHDRFFTEAKP